MLIKKNIMSANKKKLNYSYPSVFNFFSKSNKSKFIENKINKEVEKINKEKQDASAADSMIRETAVSVSPKKN